MSHITRTRARLLALIVTTLWSSSWILIRIGLDDSDLRPLTFAGLRFGLGAIVLALWVGVGGRRAGRVPSSRPRTDWWRGLMPLAGLGAVQYALTQGSQFVAIDNQPAATTNLLLVMTPLLVAFFGVLVHEPPTARHFVVGAVAVAGMSVYFVGDLGATTIGMIAAIVTVTSNAASILLGRAINRHHRWDVRRVTLASMSTSAVILLAVGIAFEGLPRLTAAGALIIGWLAVVNTAAAFTWWNVSLRELPAFEVAAVQNAMGIQIPCSDGSSSTSHSGRLSSVGSR